jgi:glutamyl-tRNA synthetase
MSSGHTTPTGRLAPSPTGGLHLGHARTFLAAWLLARSQGGRVILRIEDLDASRVRAEAVPGAIDDLRWLGLTWDEGPDVGGPSEPYIQTQRLSAYEAMLERLRRDEWVYPCTCTRADVARAASAPHVEDEGPSYPGTCAGRSAGDAAAFHGRPFAWRFRVPPGPVAWDDVVLGRRVLDPAIVGGDFIVARASIGPSYQLAVVHDDAAMGVTQVIRGLDLVPSTPRQILLHRACGWTPPTFGHLPLVHVPDGRRLAKRDGSIKLAHLRAAGVEPRAFVSWLATSLGMSDQIEPLGPAAWVDRFDPGRIPGCPWTLTDDALDALRRGQVPVGGVGAPITDDQ